jgi:AAA15 family ATPase/GTPase
MINKLSIRNFKSIKELDIDCARVNLFIGEPNTGKSNILEALGLLSWMGHRANTPLNEYARFQGIQNLFFDEIVENPVKIQTKGELDLSLDIAYKGNVFLFLSDYSFEIPYNLLSDLENNIFSDDLKKAFEDHGILISNPSRPEKMGERMGNGFLIAYSIPDKGISGNIIEKHDNKLVVRGDKKNVCNLDYTGTITKQEFDYDLPLIKFYRYNEKLNTFKDFNHPWLSPPSGTNLFSIIMGKKSLKETVSNLFKDVDLRLVLKPVENILESQKQVNDEIYGYPYVLASDTIRRMIFYNIAIDSNKNSTLVFEEPETHAFPAYIKRFGEKIAFDESNQYFIVTHNPYLFLSILEKTKKDETNVFIAYMKDYQTKVKRANDKEISKLMYDPFFNIPLLLRGKK